MVDYNKGAARTQRKFLGLKGYIALTQLVHDEYKSSGKNDGEFAVYASAKLALPRVTNLNVAQAREAAGVESNYGKSEPVKVQRLLERVTELELQVKVLLQFKANLEGK